MNNQQCCCLGHVKLVITSLAAAAHSWRHMQQRLQCRRHYLFRQGRKWRTFRVVSACDSAVGNVLNRRSSSSRSTHQSCGWLNLFHPSFGKAQANYFKKKGIFWGFNPCMWRGQEPQNAMMLRLPCPLKYCHTGDLQICLLPRLLHCVPKFKKMPQGSAARLFLLPAARKGRQEAQN